MQEEPGAHRCLGALAAARLPSRAQLLSFGWAGASREQRFKGLECSGK